MKKAFITGLCVWLTYVPHITQAIEFPTMPEGGMVDHVFKLGGSYLDIALQEGFANGFVNVDKQRIAAGPQLATPIWRTHYHYLRLELNLLNVTAFKYKEDEDKGTYINTMYESSSLINLIKFGLSVRHLINPEFIWGWYFFVDKPFSDNKEHTAWMINPGLEFIFPRYFSFSTDAVFNPQNLFGSHTDRFYQASGKLSVTRPGTADIFMAASRIKYPQQHHWWKFTFLGTKFPIPIKRWNINKLVSLGLGGTYTYNPKAANKWGRDKLFISFSLQFNLKKSSRPNSLQSYLGMPIDRYYAMPYHPGAHTIDHELAITTPRYQFNGQGSKQEPMPFSSPNTSLRSPGSPNTSLKSQDSPSIQPLHLVDNETDYEIT